MCVYIGVFYRLSFSVFRVSSVGYLEMGDGLLGRRNVDVFPSVWSRFGGCLQCLCSGVGHKESGNLEPGLYPNLT